MFKKLNKNLIGLTAFFLVAVFALVFTNQSDLYKGSVTSSNVCVDSDVEEYVLDVLEELWEVDDKTFDDTRSEYKDLEPKIQGFGLLFEKAGFDFDKDYLFLNDLNYNIQVDSYRGKFINSVNEILDDNNCDTYDFNDDQDIDDYDYPDDIDRDKDDVELVPFRFELDENVFGTRTIDEDTDDVIETHPIRTSDVQVHFYEGDSKSDVKDENFVFTLNSFYIEADSADETEVIEYDDWEAQEYEGDVVYSNWNPFKGKLYRGTTVFSYLPTGDYMFVVDINGEKFDPQDFEIDGDDVDICEYLTDDADISGYGNKGVLEILTDELEDMSGQDEDDAADHDYDFVDSIYDSLNEEAFYNTVLHARTADYRAKRAHAYGFMDVFIRMGIDNGCDIDFEDYEEIDSDFIETKVSQFDIEVELDDELDDLDHIKVDTNSTGDLLSYDGDEDPVLSYQSIKEFSDGIDFDKYGIRSTAIFEKEEIDENQEYKFVKSFDRCDINLVFVDCSTAEYLVKVGIYMGEYVRYPYYTYDADYVVFDYKKGDAFELDETRVFYLTDTEYTVNIEAKDSDFDGDVEVTSSGSYEGDDEFEMTDGKGSFEVEFSRDGYIELALKDADSSTESRIGFYVLDEEAQDEVEDILDDIVNEEEECALDLEGQSDTVSLSSKMRIGIKCNEESSRTVLNLYEESTDKAVATLYHCLSESECGDVDSVVWDSTSKGKVVKNGEYYLRVSFEIDGEKVVPERSESFDVLNVGTVGPGFPDVPANHPYLQAVNWMRGAGYIQGYPDGTFGPERCVLRAELVKMVAEATNQVGFGASQVTRSYRDVSPADWFYSYVSNASSRGWVQGYPDGSFQPGNCVTRAEAIKVAMVANNLRNVQVAGNYFADVTPNDWFYGFVTTAFTNNLVGTAHVTGSQFRPNESMTRAEVAEMLYRMSRGSVVGYGAAPGGEVIYR